MRGNMSTDFRTCPSCKTMVLADTYECTHCGHVFDEQKSQQLAEGTAPQDLKAASLEEECGNCGAMVRSGLVRCWNCNAFMREDIARRYQQLTTTPQKIIYSDIPPEKRTDYLPPRVNAATKSGGESVESENEFTLRHSSPTVTTLKSEDEFTLADGFASPPGIHVPKVDVPQVNAPKVGQVADVDGPDKPRSKTPGGKSDSSGDNANSGNDEAAGEKPQTGSIASKADDSASADDLLSIAMEEEKEAGQKKGTGNKAGTVTQILIPCPKCSNLVRASDQQAGKKVRCPKCKGPVAIPAIPAPRPKKKAARAKENQKPRMEVAWVNDAWLHVFTPTSVVLKPGSMADPHSVVDVAVTEAGVFIVEYSKETGKKAADEQNEGGMLSFVRTKLLGFLGKGGADATRAADDLRDNYNKVREQVAKTGEFKDLPNADVQTIDKEHVSLVKLVQPIVKAHESMFAGVPVFGEGRIALYLPLQRAEGEQTVLSLPISSYRTLAAMLKDKFGIEFPTAENGVPESEKTETLSCFFDQTKFEAIQDVVYYEQDSAFELELVGHRCSTCGTTISEEGRKKKKLGGVTGKGLAKAKCPKCSAKFGTGSLYRITKSPASDSEETPGDSSAA